MLNNFFSRYFKLFIGGVNRLYQVSSNLDIMATVQTGPKDESPFCGYSKDYNGCLHNATLKLTDNINKALMIDYKTGRLISCSTFHGTCSSEHTTNLLSTGKDHLIFGTAQSIVSSSEGKKRSK